MQDCASIQLPCQFVERRKKFTIGCRFHFGKKTIGCRFHFGKKTIGCKYRKLRLVPKIKATPEWVIEASHGCEIDNNSFLRIQIK